MTGRRKQWALIIDTSSLIVLLDELGFHEKLEELSKKYDLIVTREVLEEYQKPLPSFFLIGKDESFDNIYFHGLGKGEASVIRFSIKFIENKIYNLVIAVSDDKKARSTCDKLGIRCLGTLGIIELLKLNKIISKLDAIKIIDFIYNYSSLYMTRSLRNKIISKIKNQFLNII